MAMLKDRIRETARRLFEEQGYDGVTLRTIAREAGTTIGNLTYHYPQKEDLLIAIQEASQADFLAGLEDIPEEAGDILRHLLLMARKIQKAHGENAFYFKNLSKICNDFASIQARTKNIRSRIYAICLECFDRLRRNGCMRRDISIGNYSNMAYIIVLMATVWTQNISLCPDDGLPRLPFADAVRNIIYPYLTSEGMALVQKM